MVKPGQCGNGQTRSTQVKQGQNQVKPGQMQSLIYAIKLICYLNHDTGNVFMLKSYFNRLKIRYSMVNESFKPFL